jgi:ureidoglycolate hydrolase
MISATPITESAFTPYGGLVAAGLQIPTTISNPGAQKSLEVVPSTNLYMGAPSQQPGYPVVHVEVVRPKALKRNGGARTFVLNRMERHPFTSQMFIPMGSNIEYLVIVADGTAAGDAPDLSTLKVFMTREGQGVCYGAGVWHASLSVVGKVS